ncbi:MAG: hypothetical protein GY862_08955 [Gammaproteobacteria bacterium]|nr:hypothetical protein [Gammaproteobacteria bacterium]
MKHSAWNATKRNKNIGTEKSGYSQNNKFVVPERWTEDYRIFWERLVEPIICPLNISGHKITMFVEPPKKGYVHASTPHDIVKVLGLIEQEHLEEVELIVLRQPKKKEEILKPVWGRFVYYANLGKYSGPAIYLEATQIGRIIRWTNKLNPYEKKELASLESDGHRIETVKRGYDVHTSPATVRNTQLFRTLPHEIGHAADYLKHSLKPSIETNSESESDYITQVYDSKPSLDKEEYAHRYAREFYEKHSEHGSLPFDQIYEKELLKGMGLNPEWFRLQT